MFSHTCHMVRHCHLGDAFQIRCCCLKSSLQTAHVMQSTETGFIAGMLPAGVMYMSFLPSWREQFPGLEPVGLTASVIHMVPFLRDAIQLLGGRVVRLPSTHKHCCTCARYEPNVHAVILLALRNA